MRTSNPPRRHGLPLCGCWYVLPSRQHEKKYLPQIELSSATTILSCTARTKLVQTFTNTEGSDISKAQYTFPLYDGVSVVSFKCTIGDRTIFGVVKERQQAKQEFDKAVEKGDTAGLLERLPEAGDVFTTTIGNIPAKGKVTVEIVYLGELKHDAEKDGVRFTIPTVIAPRYGPITNDSQAKMFGLGTNIPKGEIKILVDIVSEEGSAIRGVESPSHPIAVTLGRNSTHHENVFQNHLASATLALSGKAELGQDFVIIINAQNQDTPRAIFEKHDILPNQRALMTTLVPKFNLPNTSPEIVFVVDRSGSMYGNISLVVQALRIFLKSLPMSIKFNICSFGSRHSFLFKKSRPYDEASLNEALTHLETFDADYGGTEMLAPFKECVKNRLKGSQLEVMLLTDGEIWNQDELFEFVNEAAKDKVRVFSLGVGSGASSSLVEGLARAGHGFAQFVMDGEQIDKRIVRMLKGALMPYISDYSLEVVYGPEEDSEEDDGFTLVESFSESMKLVGEDASGKKQGVKKVISLFTPSFKEEKPDNGSANRWDHLPTVHVPKLLQAPYKIPQLYPYTRTTIYLLFGPDSCQRCPKKVVLRGTSEHGPLELEIPVQDVGKGEMIHQLAAKTAIQDLEEGRGWLDEAKTTDGKLLKDKYGSDWERIVERETVRLGTTFQVAGKYCSFVAVAEKSSSDQVNSTGESEKNKSGLDISAPSRPLNRGILDGDTSIDMHHGEAESTGAQSDPAGGTSFGLFGAPPPPPPARKRAMFAAGTNVFARSSAPPTVRRQMASMPAPASFGGAPPGSAAPHVQSQQMMSASLYTGFGSSPVPPPPPAAPAKKSLAFGSPMGNADLARRTSASSTHGIQLSQSASRSEAVSLDKAKDDSPSSTMHAVISLQEFDGSWKKVAELLGVTGIDKASFDTALDAALNETVKSTLLAIVWLETKAQDDKDTWEMVVDKAKSWITNQGHIDVEALIASARAGYFP